MTGTTRNVLHADMDAFYASVEQRDNPTLKGKPVLVGGSPDERGVVAAASYEARSFGIRSAMPMRTALNHCPMAIRLDPDFKKYQAVSSQVMAIFRKITMIIEPLSLDEAFLDVTDSVTECNTPEKIAYNLKARVQSELNLTLSVGVATSKSVAKIASDMNKPDGLMVVGPGTEKAFLAPLPVGKLWGVGPKTTERLNKDGIVTIGDLENKPEKWWLSQFGSTAWHMRSLSLGRDNSLVQSVRKRKSISAETTLVTDTGDPEILHEMANRLSQSVGLHLVNLRLKGRTVKMKLRLSDFTTFTRQQTLSEPVDSPEEIGRAASTLLRKELFEGRKFRLVGVGVSGFENTEEQLLQPRLAGF